MTPPSVDRLYDLLALREVGPLTPAEEAEVRELQAKWPHVEPDELAAVAALLQAASAPALDPPPELFDHLEADAAAHLPMSARARPLTPRPKRNWATLGGWLVAACLLVSVGTLAWDRWGRTGSPTAEREKLLAAGATRFPSKSQNGDVVWDTATQRGYLSVDGLPPNDPAKSQYQLWIVDAGRTHKEPVDGGVFDVGADGRALVAIKPALTLRNPVLFAVTVEPPGGVVVSERGKEGKFEAVFGG